jgi:putative heme-binding domain-containing protein
MLRRPSFGFILLIGLVVLLGALTLRHLLQPKGYPLEGGDRVVFLGDGLIEQARHHGWLEVMLTTRFPHRDITFRNLGWTADTPDGDSRLGLSLLQAGREPPDEGWKQLVRQIESVQPTVVFVGYGMASSFAGKAGLGHFTASYRRLLDTLQHVSPKVRLVLLGPLPHENLGAPWPDPTSHNLELAAYDRAISEIAASRQATYISLAKRMARVVPNAPPARPKEPLTDNGIQLNDHGYRVVAEWIEDALYPSPGAWRTSPATEALRQAIVQKNRWYFNRSRPDNMAYIFGFRRKEQGNNAAEMPRFDSFISAEEKRIGQLRALSGTAVPPVPLHVGNLNSHPVEQPLPEFQVADGFEATLWAENPLIEKPVQMNFDARGRLWVACIPDYPQIEPGQAPNDKVVILEDRAGLGHADHVTVFADHLVMPMGVVPGDGGAYVAEGSELVHFQDTRGGDQANVRRLVLSGFGTEDTHHQLHTLKWGPEGRLYFNQSTYTRSNLETPLGVLRLKAGGVFRLDPRDQEMTVAYRGWVNTWGHQFDAYGQSFFTDGAGSYGVSWGVPRATYNTLAPARRVLQSISPGSYPKFCGLEIIRSEHFPADWQGDFITCDFRANRVVRFKVADQGSGYVTTPMPDVLRSTANSFRPVDVKLGPDGALYVADWSNPIIQHGEVDFRDPRRDKVHGRIWRLTAKGRPLLVPQNFAAASNPALLDQLNSPNGYNQQQARRVLEERGAEQVVPALDRWTAAHADEGSALQAMWMYQAFNRPRPALFHSLLAASNPNIRAAAIRAFPADRSDATAQLGHLAMDENPRVRLEAVRALGQIPSVAAADLALSALSRPMDPFLDYSLWLTVNELADPWIAAVKSGQWKIEGRENELAFALKAVEPDRAGEVLGQLLATYPIPRDGSGPWIELVGSAGGPRELRRLFDAAVNGGLDAPAEIRALAALDQAARLREAIPTGDLAGIGALLERGDESDHVASVRLVGDWKLAAFIPQLMRIAGTAATPDAERRAAFEALQTIGGPMVRDGLKHILAAPATSGIRQEAVLALAALDLKAAVPEIVAALKATNDPAQAEHLWRGLLDLTGAAPLLAEELSKVQLPRAVARAGLRPAREGSGNQLLVQALMRSAGLALSNVQLSAAEMRAIAAAALTKGNAARGEKLFRSPELACIYCHSVGGVGGKVGPDLTSIGASAQPDYLVESVLYPNAKIKEGYHAVVITTKAKQSFSGIIAQENDREVLLRDASGHAVSVPVRDIVARKELGSLMPAGLIDSLLPEERLDLFKFLASLGKPGPYDAANRDVARLWRIYQVVSRNTALGTEGVIRGDFTQPGWVTAPTLVDGSLTRGAIRSTLASNSASDQPRGTFAATGFTSARAGLAKFSLQGVVGEAWINGHAVKPGAQFAAEVSAGSNVLVVRFGASKSIQALRLTSQDVSFQTE